MSDKINQDCYQLNRLLAYDWEHMNNLDAQHVKQTMAALHKLQVDAFADPAAGKEALLKEWKIIKEGMLKAVHNSGTLPELQISGMPVGPIGPGSGGRGPGQRGPGDNGPGGKGDGGEPTPSPSPTTSPENPQWPKTPAYEEGDRVDISHDEYEAAWKAGKITTFLWLTYEVAKWGAAALAAPETAGASLGVAASTP